MRMKGVRVRALNDAIHRCSNDDDNLVITLDKRAQFHYARGKKI